MTGQEYYDFCTQLLAGRTMNSVLFYQLVNSAKERRERRRPWMKLRTINGSQSVDLGTTFETAFNLPEGFIQFVGQYPIRLVKGTSVISLLERPLEQLDEIQSAVGYFCVDYAQEKIYITGTFGDTYAMKISHTAFSDDIDAENGWIFGGDTGLALVFDVAIQQKGDISYDDINARMVQYHAKSVADIDQAMIMQDARLQTSSRGV